MTFYRVSMTILACLAALGVIWAAGAFGSSVSQFLAGVFGGGVLTATYLVDSGRIR